METLHEFPKLESVDAGYTNIVCLHCVQKQDAPLILGETRTTTRKRRDEFNVPWVDPPPHMRAVVPAPAWLAPFFEWMCRATRADVPLHVPPKILELMVEGSGYALVPAEQVVQLNAVAGVVASLNVNFVPSGPPAPRPPGK